MSAEPGQTLSHYRLIEKIGEGGMGVVWKALDTSLDREVAIKVLPEELAGDPDRLGRFKREAKAIAALDHPNIVTVHSVEEAEGIHFITMGLVRGKSLTELIPRNGLPLGKFFDQAVALADAISAAHQQGITHRDLKPDNVMIGDDGRLKVLDFGLAKLREEARTVDGTQLPTVTQEGKILGTVSYMSPEQAEGKPVDHRSDLFSMGVVLYEMATGQRPFGGETTVAVITAIMRDTPVPVVELRPGPPADLDRIIRHCIRKDPERRYQTAKGLRNELEELKCDVESPSGSTDTRPGPAAAPGEKTIAVLPFVDLSRGGDQEYFGDGIAEEIINVVTGLELLKVASRTSSFQFKGATTDIRKIGENLNVEMILEGSVRAAGKKLRVTAQLINVSDGYHIWSGRYDRSMEDVFTIQDEIADSIATALRAQISGNKPSAVRRHTKNVETYHLYLKGRHCWNKRHQGVLPKAIEYFNEAIDQDPTYALAYSGLADAYNVLAFYGFEPPDRGFRRAKSAAAKALEIDPELPEAYASLGYVSHHHDWDWRETESNYKRALELRGGYAVAHQWHAIYLASMGRFDEAIGSVKRARELDPLSPVINTAVGWVHYLAGMNDRALRELETAFDLDPDFPWLRYVLGQVHQELSRLDEAVSHFEAAARITNQSPFYLAGLGHCLARTGDTERAQEIRGRLERISKGSYVSAMEMALLHAGTKDEEGLFGCLDNAFEERSATLPYIAVDPRFRFAKDHPRLIGLFGKMNLDN